MVTESERQTIVDSEHLTLLSLGYWIMGGFMAVYGVFVGLYFGLIGTVFLSIPEGAEAPPTFLRWLFPSIALIALLLVGSLAALTIRAGFWIRQRRRRVANMVLAGFLCLSVPIGTMLGVATFMVLSRRSVAALYDPLVSQPDGLPGPPAPPRTPVGDEAAT